MDLRRATLLDEAAQEQLRVEGYATVPLLTTDEVHSLRQAYEAACPPGETGMVVDYMRTDRTFMRMVSDTVLPITERRLPLHFDRQRVVLTTFVAKHPGGEESAMFLHDDRSFVDEAEFRACTVWIPLVDVGPDLPNGGLQLVARSHLLPTGLAGSLTPDHIRPYEPAMRELLFTPALKAGQALVYDTRLLHASPPNTSTGARLALVWAVVPEEAPLIHVVATGRRGRAVYGVDPDFFIEHHVRDIEQQMPEAYEVAASLTDHVELTPQQIADTFGIDPPSATTVVPPDLCDDEPIEADFRWHPVAVPTDLADLQIDAATVGRSSDALLEVTVAAGAAGWAPTRRSGTACGPWAHDLARAPLPRLASDADVVVLDPGARAALDVPSSRWVHHVTVAECPILATGVRSGNRAANLAVGQRLELPPGGATTLWNDGPGPLCVIISRTSKGRVLASEVAARRRDPKGAFEAIRSALPSKQPTQAPTVGDRARSLGRRTRSLAAAAPGQAIGALLRLDERIVDGGLAPRTGPLDASTPPWAAQVRSQYDVIRGELDRLLADEVRLPQTDDLVGSPQGAEGEWTTFVLNWFGRWPEATGARCPQTAALLRQIPHVQVAGFTVLGPHTTIGRHQGPTTCMRWQMGMIVPEPAGSCGLVIGDQTVPWAERATLAFDDRTPHEAWNHADAPRYVLFIQVPWALHGWRGVAHRGIGQLFGLATARIARRAGELDRQLNATLAA